MINISPDIVLTPIDLNIPDITIRGDSLSEPRVDIDLTQYEQIQVNLEPKSLINSAQVFSNRVRQDFDSLSGIHGTRVDKGAWLQPYHLISLANKWNLPILLRNSGAHWQLITEEPVYLDGQWQARVYDPKQGDMWVALKIWNDPDENFMNQSGIFWNQQYATLKSDGIYNLNFLNDPILVDQPNLLNTLATPVQPFSNNIDCGPMCLFQCVVRSALSTRANTFVSNGLGIIEGDLKMIFPNSASSINP